MRQSWLSCGVLVGFLAACSSSTSPKPSLAGTWHVALQGLIATHVTPETLTVTVTQVNATSYHVTMAAIGWGGAGAPSSAIDTTGPSFTPAALA